MHSLRQATAADIPLIRELCYQVWPQTYAAILSQAQIDFMLEWMYSPDSLARQLREGCEYWLCYANAVPVGFAAVTKPGKQHWKLEKLYVLPQQQGHGTGRFIIEHIVTLAKTSAVKTLSLQVNKHNQARHFYEKLGFVVKEAATFDIGQGFVMDDYVMELALS